MELFKRLKQTKDPIVLRDPNSYVNLCTNLALADACGQFLDDCIHKPEYFKLHRVVFRKTSVNINNVLTPPGPERVRYHDQSGIRTGTKFCELRTSPR